MIIAFNDILLFIDWFYLSVLIELGIIPPLLQEASIGWCTAEALSGVRHTYLQAPLLVLLSA